MIVPRNHDDIFKRAVIMLVAAAFGVVVAGCNTVEGAGQDIEAAGDAIEGAAHDSNAYDAR